MTMYLIETYWPGVDQPQLAEVVARLAGTPSERRSQVSWTSSILVPDDEIVLCLATGPSADALRANAYEAGLPAERIVPCVQVLPPPVLTSRREGR